MKIKEYAAVDLCKMMCAFLVMIIHTKPFGNIFWLDAGIGLLTRFAVPYFFTVSSYFLYIKVFEGGREQYWRIIGQYLLRLFRFYMIWFVILRIVDVTIGGSKINSMVYYIKQFFFTTDGSLLWFVEALIWGVLITSVLRRIMKAQMIVAISVFFLFIGYGFSTFLEVTKRWELIQTLKPLVDYIGIQGGLFFAFPYVAVSLLLAETTLKPKLMRDSICIVLFFLCLSVESSIMVLKLNARLTFLWLSALPMTWFTVRLTLTIPLEEKKGYYILRKITTLFYVLHYVVLRLLQYGSALLTVDVKDSQNLFLTVLTFSLTFGLSYVLVHLSHKRLFTWIKYLM